MTGTRAIPIVALGMLLVTGPALTQSSPTDYRDALLRHFSGSARKVELLSDAMPEDLYTWSPGEGVYSVAQVYTHIARYNYMYLEENLGIKAPDGVDWPNFESITDKATVIELLGKSIEHVRQSVSSLSEEQLTGQTTLYGQQVPGWAVVLQLVAHMNEHVGQSIAYARMNGIVPPWSR
jgi:uncharacterized damage-inducible protein DinB